MVGGGHDEDRGHCSLLSIRCISMVGCCGRYQLYEVSGEATVQAKAVRAREESGMIPRESLNGSWVNSRYGEKF